MTSKFSSEETAPFQKTLSHVNETTETTETTDIRKNIEAKETIKELILDFSLVSHQLRYHEHFPAIDIRSMAAQWENLIDFIRQEWNLLDEEDKNSILEESPYIDDVYKYIDLYNDEDCFCRQCFINKDVIEMEVPEEGDQERRRRKIEEREEREERDLKYLVPEDNHQDECLCEMCGGEAQQWNNEWDEDEEYNK
jgi:hypothetical protein